MVQFKVQKSVPKFGVGVYVSAGGLMEATALGKKLFLSPFVLALRALYLHPEGRGENSL